MSTPAPKTAALARRAARRALARDSLMLTGRGLAAGAGAGLILVGADRVAGGLLPGSVAATALWPYLLGGAAAVGAVAGLTIAAARRWRAERAALEVDRSLGLHEGLSTAMALSARPSADWGFEHIAIGDAESAAASVNLAKALPITAEWTWGAWPVLAAGAVAIGMFVPRVAWRSAAASQVAGAELAAQTSAEVRDAVQAAREAVEKTLADRGVMDAASTDQLKQLESLERELLSSKTGAGGARVKAAESLDALADQLQSKAREDQAGHDALRERLAQSEAQSEAPAEGAASPLAEALRAGDMAGAQQAARDLLGKVGGMSEADRQSLAQDLEKLAEQVKSAPPPEAGDRGQMPPDGGGEQPLSAEPSESVKEPTPPQPPTDGASETDPERIREKLEKQGIPPDQSQRLADDIARENRDKQAKEQAQRDAEQLKENLRDAAKQARDPDAGKPQPADGQKDGQPNRQPNDQPNDQPIGQKDRSDDSADSPPQDGPRSRTGNPGKGEDPSKPGDQSKPGDKSGQKPASNQPGVKTPGAPSTTETQDGQKARQEQGQGGKPGDKPGNQPGDKPVNQPGDKPGNKPRSEPGAKPEGAKSGETPGEQPGDQPGNQPGNQPRNTPSASPGEKPADKPGNQPGAQPGEDQPGDQTGAQPGTSDGSAPGEKPGGQPGASPQPGMGEEGPNPTDPANPGADAPASPAGGQPGEGGGFQKLQQQLDRLAERQQNARQAPRISRSLRDRAQQLLDQASKEDRAAMERWAQESAKERPDRPAHASDTPPWDGPTDLVDGRAGGQAWQPPTDPSEHIIAEWFSNQGIDRSGAAAGSAQMTEQVQQASQGAERAIEQQNIPRRHAELIRRIFRRYTQRAEGEQPPPLAVDATDAVPTKGGGK